MSIEDYERVRELMKRRNLRRETQRNLVEDMDAAMLVTPGSRVDAWKIAGGVVLKDLVAAVTAASVDVIERHGVTQDRRTPGFLGKRP